MESIVRKGCKNEKESINGGSAGGVFPDGMC